MEKKLEEMTDAELLEREKKLIGEILEIQERLHRLYEEWANKCLERETKDL